MTSPALERYPVRVMVTPVWDHIPVQVDGATTVAQLKREALRTALKRSDIDESEYIVKFRGALLLDESMTIGALQAGPNAPFIVLPGRRQPVR
jgi:hypothetical protein